MTVNISNVCMHTNPTQGAAVPSPKNVAAREPLLPPPVARLVRTMASTVRRQPPRVRVGVCLTSLQGATPVQAVTTAKTPRRSTRRGAEPHAPYVLATTPGSVLVVLREGLGGSTLLQAYWHARLVAEGQQARVPWLLQHWEDVLQRVEQAGWELDQIHLGAGGERWGHKGD